LYYEPIYDYSAPGAIAMRVAVVTVQIPFISGGAELLADGLLRALRSEGHEAEIVAIPFKHYPPERIADHMLVCRLLDLTESFGNPIDRVIGLKFPAYFVPHPAKVLWILHQHRSAYELWDHPQAGDLRNSPNGRLIRDTIRQADRNLMRESRAIFTISRNVSRRLLNGCGIESTPLYNPPAGADSFYCATPGEYLLYPSRLNPLKRQTLILEALALTRQPVRVVFAGPSDHPQLDQECERLVRKFDLNGRVQFLGQVPESEKRKLYAEALGVLFTPVDEDYGYVTLEAMLARKPVLTCTDSGGPLEFVEDQATGIVAEPTAEAIADGMDAIWADRSRAGKWGAAGYERYQSLNISWSHVVDQLLA
jgi:glycosyltransferase involved in cell wall biosynthesis